MRQARREIPDPITKRTLKEPNRLIIGYDSHGNPGNIFRIFRWQGRLKTMWSRETQSEPRRNRTSARGSVGSNSVPCCCTTSFIHLRVTTILILMSVAVPLLLECWNWRDLLYRPDDGDDVNPHSFRLSHTGLR